MEMKINSMLPFSLLLFAYFIKSRRIKKYFLSFSSSSFTPCCRWQLNIFFFRKIYTIVGGLLFSTFSKLHFGFTFKVLRSYSLFTHTRFNLFTILIQYPDQHSFEIVIYSPPHRLQYPPK